MPSYSETNDVTKPDGSRALSLGDDDLREYKRSIDERLNEDHVKPNDETGITTVGYHRKCTLIKLDDDPTAVDDTIIFYCKSDGSTDELFAIDESSNIVQILKSGNLAVLGVEGWRSGDTILSSNTNTPSGWTDKSSTYDDRFIRISADTPLDTGGADSHTHGAGSYSVSGTTGTPSSQVLRDGSTFATSAHDHTHEFSANVDGTSASASNVPVYVQMKMYSKD